MLLCFICISFLSSYSFFVLNFLSCTCVRIHAKNFTFVFKKFCFRLDYPRSWLMDHELLCQFFYGIFPYYECILHNAIDLKIFWKGISTLNFMWPSKCRISYSSLMKFALLKQFCQKKLSVFFFKNLLFIWGFASIFSYHKLAQWVNVTKMSCFDSISIIFFAIQSEYIAILHE